MSPPDDDDESMSRVFSKRDDLFCEIFFPKARFFLLLCIRALREGEREQTKQTLTCVNTSFICLFDEQL